MRESRLRTCLRVVSVRSRLSTMRPEESNHRACFRNFSLGLSESIGWLNCTAPRGELSRAAAGRMLANRTQSCVRSKTKRADKVRPGKKEMLCANRDSRCAHREPGRPRSQFSSWSRSRSACRGSYAGSLWFLTRSIFRLPARRVGLDCFQLRSIEHVVLAFHLRRFVDGGLLLDHLATAFE